MQMTLRDRRKLQTRVEILDAAWSLLLAQGLEATRMSEIAAVAGVSEQTVYNHFPSKDELALAGLEQQWSALSPFGVRLADVPDHLGPAEALLEAVRQVEWPDTEAEQRSRDLYAVVARDPGLRQADAQRALGVSRMLAGELASRAERAGTSGMTLEVICRVTIGVFYGVLEHQPERVVPGRWRTDLLRELDRALAGFR